MNEIYTDATKELLTQLIIPSRMNQASNSLATGMRNRYASIAATKPFALSKIAAKKPLMVYLITRSTVMIDKTMSIIIPAATAIPPFFNNSLSEIKFSDC